MLSESRYPALTLNADMTICGTWTWRDAIRAIYRNIAEPVAFYDKAISSPSTRILLPSIIRLHRYVNLYRPATFTRRNLFLTYAMRCAFCTNTFRSEDLTFEHVIPKSRGGNTSWENIVPACEPCNAKKGNRTPAEAKMPLRIPIRRPIERELIEQHIRLAFEDPPHDSWNDYFSDQYWNIPLIEDTTQDT